MMWLRMAGYINYISYRYVFISLFRFTYKVRGTKTEQSDVATYGVRIHVYILFRVCLDHSTVAMYGGTSKLYIMLIRIYILFCFTDKVRGEKTNQSDVATYGGIIHVYIFLWVQIFG